MSGTSSPRCDRHRRLVRYSFYLVGTIVLGMIGIGAISIYNSQPRALEERPSFRLAAPDLARLPIRAQVVTSGRSGRMELLQYGALHNRDVNFSIGMGLARRRARHGQFGAAGFQPDAAEHALRHDLDLS